MMSDYLYLIGTNKYKYMRELVCLDLTMSIDVPEYKGNRLQPKLRDFLVKVT